MTIDVSVHFSSCLMTVADIPRSFQQALFHCSRGPVCTCGLVCNDQFQTLLI